MPLHARTRTVYVRNDLGRFAAELERARRRSIERSVERGARISRRLAPSGTASGRRSYATRPGYVPLKNSIRTRVNIAGNQGYWYSIAPHSDFVEHGTEAHLISGKLKFWWRGGFFYWNNPRYGPVGSGKSYENWTRAGGAWVFHPGTKAQPFLRPAYDRMRVEMNVIVKQEYAKVRV